MSPSGNDAVLILRTVCHMHSMVQPTQTRCHDFVAISSAVRGMSSLFRQKSAALGMNKFRRIVLQRNKRCALLRNIRDLWARTACKTVHRINRKIEADTKAHISFDYCQSDHKASVSVDATRARNETKSIEMMKQSIYREFSMNWIVFNNRLI